MNPPHPQGASLAYTQPPLIMSFRKHRVAVAAAALAIAGCRSPAADAALMEQMRSLADELNAARQDAGMLNERFDSLQVVVARQDTLLRQLASMANIPVPPQR